MAKPPSFDEMHANPKNPRKITQKQLAELKRSLEEFGDLGGIVVNHDGTLISGHQRFEAMRASRGAKIVDSEVLDLPSATGTIEQAWVVMPDGERFSWRRVDWDAQKAQLAMLAANKQGGEWAMDKLTDTFAEMSDWNVDLDLTGFAATERNSFDSAFEAPIAPPEEPLGEQALPNAPQSKPGDVFLLGNHHLMCGDSSSTQAIDRLLAGKRPHMVYTDPPYGMRLKADWSQEISGVSGSGHSTMGLAGRKYKQIIGDDADFDAAPLLGYFADVPEMFLWGADYYCQQLPKNGSWTVWDKRTRADGEAINQIGSSVFELCWSKKKHGRDMARILWAGLCQGPKEGKRVHPTQKPVALAEWFFSRWGAENDLVVDLYGGSGSTLLACENMNRTCYMMEIDPSYCDVIINRWEQKTGKQAILLDLEDAQKAHDAS